MNQPYLPWSGSDPFLNPEGRPWRRPSCNNRNRPSDHPLLISSCSFSHLSTQAPAERTALLLTDILHIASAAHFVALPLPNGDCRFQYHSKTAAASASNRTSSRWIIILQTCATTSITTAFSIFPPRKSPKWRGRPICEAFFFIG